MRKAPCKYCAQVNTHKDELGYCKRYDCLSRSGMRDILNSLVKQAREIHFIPNAYSQIGRVVTNTYSVRTREANSILGKAIKHFGLVPSEVYNAIPKANKEQWDKHIRW